MDQSGFQRPRSKRYGGLTGISLASAADVLEVVYDTDGRCAAIALRPGASFARYDFGEESARYTETVETEGGLCKTVHELVFSLARLDRASGAAVDSIARASREGLLAIVTTACGESLLVGHTPELGAAFPLRLRSAAAATGSRSTDDTARRVELRCESVSYARTVISE